MKGACNNKMYRFIQYFIDYYNIVQFCVSKDKIMNGGRKESWRRLFVLKRLNLLVWEETIIVLLISFLNSLSFFDTLIEYKLFYYCCFVSCMSVLISLLFLEALIIYAKICLFSENCYQFVNTHLFFIYNNKNCGNISFFQFCFLL